MGLQIEDGEGKGVSAGVTNGKQLKVQSENRELQHYNSLEYGRAYQVIGDVEITGGTQTVMHMTNDSQDKLAISFVRLQAVDFNGGTAPPNSGTYYQFGFDTSYVSNGDSVTPVNMNRASNNTADVTAYDNAPTITGDFTEADRWFPTESEDMIVFNKQGSIILGQNNSFEIRITSNASSGLAYSRTTFFYVE